ncbi:MAG: RelA/SpoT domain-containing protein [Cyanobacteria bacterium HKST-UBA04]|nr:RelA/SpoT domain-containing protein [Cyanobacteria bacterium HKST-UBA04]
MSRNIKPEHSRERVNRAGHNVRSGSLTSEDIDVIENWRAAHNKILNDWQSNLRNRCKKNKKITFAQRLKRRNTIFDKLTRQPEMQLSRMHDIAGCRLIFPDIASLHEYRNSLHESRMKHVLRKADEAPYPYDYMEHPHPDNSGYRGIHDVFKYCARPGRSQEWNNLLVEIQYRTSSQHAWATAVEIAGHITGNYSKFDQGDEQQKEFFRLTSEIIARAHEGMTSCYPTATNREIIQRFTSLEQELHLLMRLKSLKIAGDLENFTKQNVILLLSNVEDERGQLTFTAYSYEYLPEATNKYFELEKKYGEKYDIVLVRAPSKESLMHAYKNYFSDSQDFDRLVIEGLELLKK